MTPLEQKIEQLAAGNVDGLLECPFCGGSARIERYGDSRQSTLYECEDCSCHLETGEEFGHGKRWNTRAKTKREEVQAKVIEMFVGLLEKAELLTVSGADIFNSEGSRLLRISNAQREEALRIAAKMKGVG